MARSKRKPTAKQLAARAKFIAMVRAKAAAQKKKNPTKKGSSIQTRTEHGKKMYVVPSPTSGGKLWTADKSVALAYEKLWAKHRKRKKNTGLSTAQWHAIRARKAPKRHAPKRRPPRRAARPNPVAMGSRVRLSHVKLGHTGRTVPGVWTVIGRSGPYAVVRHSSGAVINVKPSLVTRANPGTSAEAREAYRRFHWGDEAGQSRPVSVPKPHGPLMQVGKLHAVAYTTQKGGEKATWEHVFKTKPTLASDRRGKLFIVGGDYRMKVEGITG